MLHSRLRTHLILAPTTGVGKTIASVLLLRSSLFAKESPTYLKPVGTFSPNGEGDDLAHVKKYVGDSGIRCESLWRWNEEKGPHLSGLNVNDDQFVRGVSDFVGSTAKKLRDERGALFIESAGGVHSPLFSGTSQIESYRPLLPPTILISCSELGGISTTISSYESILMRGYEIDLVILWKEEFLKNWNHLSKFFERHDVQTILIDRPPLEGTLWDYYSETVEKSGKKLIETLRDRHEKRIRELRSAPEETLKKVWFPFVQHSNLRKDEILTISSAHRDFFTIFENHHDDSNPSLSNSNDLEIKDSPKNNNSLQSLMFDGSASWWTQGLGHSNPSLLYPLIQSAGRYGHVIFSKTIHLPALRLTLKLLKFVGKGWASRVFYSDDGSTGVEVALKMGIRLARKRGRRGSLILGFCSSYHGDTLGAMEASQPGTYNKRVEWYGGRGIWIDPPTIEFQSEGRFKIRFKGEGGEGEKEELEFKDLEEIFDIEKRLKSSQVIKYSSIIEKVLRENDSELSCLIIEPICLGAGGMLFVDPLFQHLLINLCRSFVDPPLPIIFDEVFVGLGRLGPLSTTSMLRVKPDIAVYGKLLTGGLLPLAATLTTEEVFEAFKGSKKEEALLHGHSYTAHPIGCQVAEKSLDLLIKKFKDSDKFKKGWKGSNEENFYHPWSFWDKEFIKEIVKKESVKSVMTLGCVLKIELKTIVDEIQGYESDASEKILKNLRTMVKNEKDDDFLDFNIHARPLGNVIYFMTSLTTESDTISRVQDALLKSIP